VSQLLYSLLATRTIEVSSTWGSPVPRCRATRAPEPRTPAPPDSRGGVSEDPEAREVRPEPVQPEPEEEADDAEQRAGVSRRSSVRGSDPLSALARAGGGRYVKAPPSASNMRSSVSSGMARSGGAEGPPSAADADCPDSRYWKPPLGAASNIRSSVRSAEAPERLASVTEPSEPASRLARSARLASDMPIYPNLPRRQGRELRSERAAA